MSIVIRRVRENDLNFAKKSTNTVYIYLIIFISYSFSSNIFQTLYILIQ